MSGTYRSGLALKQHEQVPGAAVRFDRGAGIPEAARSGGAAATKRAFQASICARLHPPMIARIAADFSSPRSALPAA